MSESVSESDNGPATVPTPAIVKEAEVKLKEMSRKAKERKTASVPRKPPQRQSGTNALARGTSLRLVLIGGLGVGVLGILYLMLGRGPKEEFVSSPNKNPVREIPQKPESKSVSPIKEKPSQFEMNSF